MNRTFPSAVALLPVLTAAAVCWAGDAAPAPAPQRPAYQVQRFNEDWSVLRKIDQTKDHDFFDPIKYVPLSESGDVWASFGGQVRLRYEAWNNFNFSGPATANVKHDDDYLLTRISFHTDVHVGPNVRVFVEGRSSLATDRDLFGGNRTADRDELDLQYGFVDLLVPLDDSGDSITFRAGRQAFLLGKQRLVSSPDWTNTRRTFEGFSGILKLDSWTATGFWLRFVPVQKYEFNEEDANTDFFGVYATGKTPVAGMSMDLYYLGLSSSNIAFTSSAFGSYNGTIGIEDRHTVGGRLFGKVGESGLDYDLEGAYQFGSVGAGDVNAYMIATQLGYSAPTCPTSPRVFVGLDYASGDESPGGDVQTFCQLFPSGHTWLGWIDQVGRQNIIDLNTGLTVKPVDKLTVDLHGHVFWRADDSDALYNSGGTRYRPGGAGAVPGGMSRFVGSELDLLAKYALDRHTEIGAGYSHFFTGAFLEQTGPAPDIDLVYLILQYTF